MPGSGTSSDPDPRTWLSGPALELYEHLEQVGAIRRLKQMPLSGAVAWFHPEIKHTRWDYVALMLRLAARIERLDSVFGEFGKVRVEGHQVGAGRDLIQCWAMLVNCGHLWGTFATERLVLDALAVGGKARAHFLEGLPTEADRGYARWVFDHYMLYRMAMPLATGFFHVLPEHRCAEGRAMWLAMVRAFSQHGHCGAKVLQLYRVYHVLRRLAYLHLDLAYAHLPVALDISAVERDPARYLRDVLVRQSGPLLALLDSVSQYVPQQIYLVPEVVLARRLLQARAGPRVGEELNGAGSPDELFAKLERMKSSQAWPAAADVVRNVQGGQYVHLRRVARPRHESVIPKVFWAQAPLLQSRLTRRVGADSLVHVTAGDAIPERLIDFYVRPEIGPGDLARTLTVICDQMARPPAPPGRSPARQPRAGFQVRELVAGLLSLMLRETMRVRARDHPELSADASFLLVDGRSADSLRERVEGLLTGCREEARRRELELLGASLARRPAGEFRAAMLNGFEVADEGQNPRGRVEFDGASIDVGAEAATLYLVGAGPQSGGAMRQLRGRLRRLGWLKGSEVVAVEGGAEAAVPIRPRGRR